MCLRGDISILVPAIFTEIVAILTAPAVDMANWAHQTTGTNGTWLFEGQNLFTLLQMVQIAAYVAEIYFLSILQL